MDKLLNPLSDYSWSANRDCGRLDGLCTALVLVNPVFRFVSWSAPGDLFAVAGWEMASWGLLGGVLWSWWSE